MSIRIKLILGFLGVSLIGGLVGLVGILSLSQIRDADTAMYDNGTMGLVYMQRLSDGLDAMKVAVRDEALSLDATENQRAYNAYREGEKLFNKALADYGSTTATDEDKANYAALKPAAAAYVALAERLMNLGLQNQNEEAAAIMRTAESAKIRNDIGAAVKKIVDYNVKYNNDLYHENLNSSGQAILIMLILLVAGVVISVGLGLLVTNSITKPVKRVNEELSDASKALESASLQVSDSSQQLSSSSSELASSIEEMTSSLEELQSIIEANTKNVNQSELLMQETNTGARKVSEKMVELKGAMTEISGNSKKIGKIIKVIDDIAFQTNILALNAAVEAARAGDAGKGFAVVADQVKALAQKSADAAKETADLIERAISSSDRGEALGTEVNEAQLVAAEKAGKVAVLLDEVNRASKEQLKGANQITQAVTQINAIVQTTASSSEENAAAGEELLGQSETLGQNVVALARIVNGKNAVPQEAVPAERAARLTVKRASGRGSLAMTHSAVRKAPGIEVTKPEDVIPLKDFKDF